MIIKKQTSFRYFRNLALKRTANGLLVLFGVTFLVLLGLYMARQGNLGLPTSFSESVLIAFQDTYNYIFHHPGVYIWHKEIVPAGELVQRLFFNSAGLLFVSLCIATIVGGSLGIIAARLRNRNISPIVILVSILGVSTPSFLLGMLFWILNVQIGRWAGLGKAPLPPTGFGWDFHLILPALVLATRPMAQIAQVTYVNLAAVLDKEYITAAKARGVPGRMLIYTHALRNTLIPILTTLGTSLRFSLASLPVVEAFFLWDGLGLAILQAIELNMPELITDLVVSLGLMFLLINAFLEFIFPLIDPRLRKMNGKNNVNQQDWGSPSQQILEGIQTLKVKFSKLIRRKSNTPDDNFNDQLLPLPELQNKPTEMPSYASSKTRLIIKSVFRNPAFVLGTILVIGFFFLAFFGENLTTANPFQTNNIAKINGQIYGPPFPPSPEFPWGSDALGRDLKSLVLAGAKQTITLAAIGMLARILIGVLFGLFAGFWENSWLDRIINALIAIWAAFPTTLFAMIFILALGIQRGMSIFIIALCVVGWGEIAQVVRGQVLGQKPLLYIEAARSVGAGVSQVLVKHILPHLIPTVLVLSALEMGGILMLLAELGFLNIFLGGGFRVELLGAGIYSYSDAPEWAALLANIRNWWRSYPWLAWYPGGIFFLAILSFNLWGEGLRRFLDDAKINLANLINRYTALSAVVIIIGLSWLFQSSTPLELYKTQAKEFNAEQAYEHISELSSPMFSGRETGTTGNLLAAEYIAEQMEEIGLFPAGEKNTFLQKLTNPRFHLSQTPVLEMLDNNQSVVQNFTYRKDFVEFIQNISWGDKTGPVVGITIREGPHEDALNTRGFDLSGKIAIIREQDLEFIEPFGISGLMVVSDEQQHYDQKYLFPTTRNNSLPALWITSQTADKLLATANSSLEALAAISSTLGAEDVHITEDGMDVHLSVVGRVGPFEEKYNNVIGYIPGSGSNTGARLGEGLDNQVIIVSAYLDGIGTSPDGTFYPGANDNASGVAEMLEIARVMKNAQFPPKKTVVFVAWSGAERYEGLSINNIMNAKTGFAFLEVESVLELSGVGAGTGDSVLLQKGSSFRLANLYRDASNHLNISLTNRGRGPHYGWGDTFGFGGRTALTAYISWDGSNQFAHTPMDNIESIDIDKLNKSGQLNALVLSVLSRETDY